MVAVVKILQRVSGSVQYNLFLGRLVDISPRCCPPRSRSKARVLSILWLQTFSMWPPRPIERASVRLPWEVSLGLAWQRLTTLCWRSLDGIAEVRLQPTPREVEKCSVAMRPAGRGSQCLPELSQERLDPIFSCWWETSWLGLLDAGTKLCSYRTLCFFSPGPEDSCARGRDLTCRCAHTQMA